MKEIIFNHGVFNNWKGCISLYLTKKQVRSLKKYGIREDTTIKEAYTLLSKTNI